jgi:hypothetical protein
MSRVLTISISLCVVCLACAACGDDDDDTLTVVGVDASAPIDSGADAAQGDDAGSDGGFSSVSCSPSGSGACQNAEDCPVVESGDAREAASSCGIGCLGDSNEASCAQSCVVNETGLSTACAKCYVAIVTCSRTSCLTDCLSDPDSTACFDCQVAAGCRESFDECSGLPPPR